METKHEKGLNFFQALIVCLSLLVLVDSPASANEWSYPGDPGFVATSPEQLPVAKASWETPEYGNYTGHDPLTPGTAVNWPWQLAAVNASTAYALGYYGQGVTLGMMDSGYRPTHEAFQTGRIFPVRAAGVYGTSGFGYRNATPANPFNAGEPFVVDGDQAENNRLRAWDRHAWSYLRRARWHRPAAGHRLRIEDGCCQDRRFPYPVPRSLPRLRVLVYSQ